MTARELVWRKSSYSADQGDCVEVAWPDRDVAVRDSKQPAGPTLAFPTRTWQAFLTDVR
jgi:hypothetical protein